MNRAQRAAIVIASTVATGVVLVGVSLPATTIAGAAVPTTSTTTETHPDDSTYDEDYPTTEPTATGTTDTYLVLVGAEIPTATDTDLLDAGSTVCTVLDETTDPDENTLIGIGMGLTEVYGWTLPQTGSVVGGAVAAFCPQYGYVIDQL